MTVGAQRDGHVLVGLAVARQDIGGHFRVEADELFVLRAFVFTCICWASANTTSPSLLGDDMDAAVAHHLRFETRAHDGGFGGLMRGTAWRIMFRAHESTVGIVVFEERMRLAAMEAI